MNSLARKKELFYFSTTALGLFSLLELLHPNLVIAYFNLNWLLTLWVFSLFLIIKNSNK